MSKNKRQDQEQQILYKVFYDTSKRAKMDLPKEYLWYVIVCYELDIFERFATPKEALNFEKNLKERYPQAEFERIRFKASLDKWGKA